jgi:hypothetical protein
MTRKPLIGVSLLALALALAGPARGDLKHNGRFVFAPQIRESDPVNVFFSGGNAGQDCPNITQKTAACAEKLVEDVWGLGAMRKRTCNGSQVSALRFRTENGGTTDPPEQVSSSTSTTCKKQYHMRYWGDGLHGEPRALWVVTPIHHENRCAVPFACTHHINMDWERVEYITRHTMAGAVCGRYDEYAFPGTEGKFQKKYSDGYLTRISWQDKYAYGCRGA